MRCLHRYGYVMYGYQMVMRSDSGRNILSPALMPKALKKGSMLRSDTLTRFTPSEWGSAMVRRRFSSSRMLLAQRLA